MHFLTAPYICSCISAHNYVTTITTYTYVCIINIRTCELVTYLLQYHSSCMHDYTTQCVVDITDTYSHCHGIANISYVIMEVAPILVWHHVRNVICFVCR